MIKVPGAGVGVLQLEERKRMAAVLMVMAVIGVISFSVTVLVIHRSEVHHLTRNPDRSAKVRVSGKGLAAFGLLLLGVWACVSAAVILVAYTDVLPAVVIGALIFMMALLRPAIQAKGRSVFDISSETTVGR